MRLLTLRSLLVATDLEGGSVPALRSAARLSALSGAELHLLHVSETPLRDGVDRLREEYARAAPNGPGLVTVEILSGSAPAAIVDQAARLGAEAIVLGPHRRGAGRSEGMGSTASAVVRSARCPCLVAAAELNLPLEQVLAAVDLSRVAKGTLNVALSWASALRPRGRPAILTALHVDLESGNANDGGISAKVERTRRESGEAAHVEVRTKITPGTDAAQSILEAASAGSVDLLVMGTRRASHDPDELGSVSAAVARATVCPLLLVPPSMAATAAVES